METILKLIKQTFEEFVRDNASQMAAALAYYALFAIPSVLLISINLLGIFLKDEQIQQLLFIQIQHITGASISGIMLLIMHHLDTFKDVGNIAQWVGIVALIVASYGAFAHLHTSLNTIWNIAPHPSRKYYSLFLKRISAMIFLFVIGSIVLASFAANTILNAIGSSIELYLGISAITLQLVDGVVLFVGVVAFIALVYRLIPEGTMSWRDIFMGSVVTSALFLPGKYLIGFFINQNIMNSIYGAAGSLLALLIWIYYLSLIFFFGAEFTQVYSHMYGSGVRPDRGAISKKPNTP